MVVSFVFPEAMTIQVMMLTETNFTMRSPVLEYRSVMIYYGDKLLADISGMISIK